MSSKPDVSLVARETRLVHEAHRHDEVEQKIERVIALARQAGVHGILLSLQPSFAWITGGRSNRIDGSRETGAGAVLVTTEGRRYIIANHTEAPRLAEEAVSGLAFEVADFPWTAERADPSFPAHTAQQIAGGTVGSDVNWPQTVHLEPAIARLRSPLVPHEIERYRRLGRDAGRIAEQVMRSATPGTTETQAAGALASALAGAGMRPLVLLAAGDGRIARYRHPLPTDLSWTNQLLLATCAERSGLVVALSRIICTRKDNELERRTHAAAVVFGALLNATTASASGARIFEAAAAAYAANGFPGEERRHHQGGAIGYRAREWVAHPGSEEVARLPQAFAWNPTIAGTKVEETCVIGLDGEVEILTASPHWPSLEVPVRDRSVRVPDVLVI